MVISDQTMIYYHCIDGCTSRGSPESHQYYLCSNCADSKCNSPQKFLPSSNSKPSNMAFYGVWTSFAAKGKQCSIMIMHQESNRISFRLKTGNAFKDRQNTTNHGSIVEKEENGTTHLMLKLDDDGTKRMGFRDGILRVKNPRDASDVVLKFKSERGSKKYHKAMPQCTTCNGDMMFMFKGTVPNQQRGKLTDLQCSHSQHDAYAQDMAKYATMKCMNYAMWKDLKKSWYYWCTRCCEGICAGCALISSETAVKQKVRERKDQTKRNSGSVKSVSVRSTRNGRKRTFVEMNGGNEESQSEVESLRRELKKIKTERDYWKSHYLKLSNLLESAEKYHQTVIERQ